MSRAVGAPLVSVVVATYDWSNALRCAVRSVLAQTCADFEVRVVGDGCTDDSAEVVASFADPRVHWDNLPENSGSQSLPNNRGVATARGAWIAYLGHDDLWHPTHLARLVAAARDGDAEILHALALIVHPDGKRSLSGLFPPGASGEEDMVVPSCLMHRRELFDRIGGWLHWRDSAVPHDFEWQQRARRAGARFRAVERLTVFKFTSSLRRNSYVLRRSDEQEAWWGRIAAEPDLPERELVEVLRGTLGGFDPRVRPPLALAGAPPGFIVEQLRWIRGLEPDVIPMSRLPERVDAAALPLVLVDAPATLAPGAETRLAVRVSNDTDLLVSSRLPHPVHLSYRWRAADGTLVEADGLRSVLVPPLAPGATRVYACVVRAPAAPGDYRLRVALVQEDVRWLERESGDRDATVAVVAPPTAAG